MKNLMSKSFIVGFLFCMMSSFCIAQTAFTPTSSSVKVTSIFERIEDSLQKQFEAKKLMWPPKSVFVRSFKYAQKY